MYFINLILDNTEICAYFTQEAFANQERSPTDDEQASILEDITVQICQALLTDETSKSHYKKHGKIDLFINNLILPEQDNHTKAVVQCSYELRAGICSKPIVLHIDLNTKPTFAYEIEPLMPLSLYDEDTETFLKEQSTQGEAEWVAEPAVKEQQKTVIASAVNPPSSSEASPRIDFLLAPDQHDDDIIKALCTSAALSEDEQQIAAHLLPDKNLRDELLPLVKLADNEQLYLDWIDRNVQSAGLDQDTRLANYILHQKSKLLRFMIEKKETAILAFIEDNQKTYDEHMSTAQPTEYLSQFRKLNYIRKNIIVALHNAAKDYYKEIFGSLKKEDITEKDSASFAKKLLSFNMKFQGIAQIHTNTLELSPLEDALKSLKEYPHLRANKYEMSLEQAVDLLLQRCAHINSGDTTTTSFGRAFTCAQENLNKFNNSDHTNLGYEEQDKDAKLGTLFFPINAPGESSTIGAGIRFFTFGRRVLDVGAKLARMTNKLFRFADETAQLDEDLAEAERHFRKKLTEAKKMMDVLHEKAQAIIKEEEKDEPLKNAYAKANDNITAFENMLLETALVNNKIKSIKSAIDKQNEALEPFLTAKATLNSLAEKYEITPQDAKQFALVAFNEDTYSRLEEEHEKLQLQAARIPTTENLEEMISSAYELDSLLTDETSQHKHAATIKGFKNEIKECFRCCSNIADAITHHQENVIHGKSCIQTAEACDNVINRLTIFREEINARNFNTLLPSSQYDPPAIEKAKQLLTNAQREFAELEDLTDATERAFSESNPDDQMFIAAIKAKSATAIENAYQDLRHYKKNLYDLLLCNMTINAARNFAHWEKQGKALDAKVTLNELSGIENRLYKIPTPIYAMAVLASEDRFIDWETDPQKARDLLAAMKALTTEAKGSHEIKQFQLRVHQMIDLENAHDLAELTQNLARLNQTSQQAPVNPKVTIKPQGIRVIQHQATGLDKYPNLKKAIIGALIGIAVIAVVAAICTACAFTGGAPIIVAGAASVMAIGGAGFAAGLLAAITLAAGTIGALIGFQGNKAWQKRKATKAQAQANDNPNDGIFGHDNYGFGSGVILPATPKVKVTFQSFLSRRTTPPADNEETLVDGYQRRPSFDK